MKPRDHPEHTLTRGCRYAEDGGVVPSRRLKQQLGVRAGAGPARDPMIPAAGVADTRPVTDDDLELDIDVPSKYEDNSRSIDVDDRVAIEEETIGILGALGRQAVTKEERE